MSTFSKFSNTKIMVVGDVMLDRYWWGSVDRISPEAPVPIVRLEEMSLVAGGAANVAANLAGLGITPILVGIKGDDEEGDRLTTVLTEAGLDSGLITTIPGRKSTIKTRIVAHHQHVVRIDQETTEPISEAVADATLQRISEAIIDVDAILISDYAKGFLSDHLLAQLIDLAREKDKLVVVDPKGKDFAKYRGASVITPNKREAIDACSLDPSHADVVETAGRELTSSLDLQAVLITEGENGMTLFEQGSEPFHLDSWAHDVFDVTGAGDTVIATFTAVAAVGDTLTNAAKLANAAASIVVGTVGTTRVTTKALDDFLSTSEHAEGLKTLHA